MIAVREMAIDVRRYMPGGRCRTGLAFGPFCCERALVGLPGSASSPSMRTCAAAWGICTRGRLGLPFAALPYPCADVERSREPELLGMDCSDSLRTTSGAVETRGDSEGDSESDSYLRIAVMRFFKPR